MTIVRRVVINIMNTAKKQGSRTYALMRAANSVSRRIDSWSNSLTDEKTDPPTYSPMHLADVHGIFDE
jgi:hypothetical protein